MVIGYGLLVIEAGQQVVVCSQRRFWQEEEIGGFSGCKDTTFRNISSEYEINYYFCTLEHKEQQKMCTYNITVDENMLEQLYPNVGREKFGELLQKWIDDMMSDDTPVAASRISPNAHTYEKMKTALHERVDKIEAAKATFHTNEEVFSSIRDRYGI